MLCDTNFLIAYGKGTKSVSKQRARAYFDTLPSGTPCFISRVTWMEFVAGFETPSAAAPHLAPFTVLEIDVDLWWAASRVIRDLGLRGKPIGSPDSMIAATALAYGLPLVTNNTKHFQEVTGLDVREYYPGFGDYPVGVSRKLLRRMGVAESRPAPGECWSAMRRRSADQQLARDDTR